MKRVHFFVVFFCFISMYSQEKKPAAKEIIRALILKKSTSLREVTTVFLTYKKDIDTIHFLLNECINSSYLEGQLIGFNSLGRYYRDHSFFNKSIFNHKKAYEIATEIDNVLFQIKILNSIGSVYRRQDDIRNALNYHQRALLKASSIKNPTIDIKQTISIAQNSMGNIYLSLRQYKLALKEFSTSIITQKEINHKLGLAINYQNIGYANQELGYLDIALENYNTSLYYNGLINSDIGKIICNYSIASLFIKQKKYTEALRKVNSILPIAIKENDKYYLSSTYNVLGLAQVYLNKPQAEQTLLKALKISKEHKVQNSVVKAYEYLAILYEKQNSYKKAFIYYRKAIEEDAKTFNDRNLKYIRELTTRQEKDRVANQIKNLAKQHEITQLQLTKSKNTLILIIVSSILICVLLFSFYKFRYYQNKTKILFLKQEALQSQMNPHFIFNALNSIKLYIINNEQKNAVKYLNKFAKLIRRILEASQIRETTLYQELETMEVYMSIENIRFLNEINYRTIIDPLVNTEQVYIPPLILQPFLENALWHGLSSKKGEKKIELSVHKKDDNFIEITIEDNGIGRKAAVKIKENKSIKRKSIGINLTKDRLKKFNSQYLLTYSDVHTNNLVTGTKVCLKTPFK
ncbi:MAG: histidine kinase [Flavobacteriaceae bacterium]|nr:histidine kinase [Flavobacteriaceae bacterium]